MADQCDGDERFQGTGSAQQNAGEHGQEDELGQHESPSGPSTSASAEATDGSDFVEGGQGVLDEEDPASGSGSGEGD